MSNLLVDTKGFVVVHGREASPTTAICGNSLQITKPLPRQLASCRSTRAHRRGDLPNKQKVKKYARISLRTQISIIL